MCLLVSASARADWPESTLVLDDAGGDHPIGGAIKNWGPNDEVFFLIDELTPEVLDPAINNATFKYFTCSNNDVCETATQEFSDGVGYAMSHGVALHPSLAVRSASGDRHVQLVLRQEFQDDCDEDGFDSFDPAQPNAVPPNNGGEEDKKVTSLDSYVWNTDTQTLEWSKLPGIDQFGNECYDFGFSVTRFLGSTAYTCFTRADHAAPDDGVAKKDEMACNNTSSVGTFSWQDGDTMPVSAGEEDHGSFDFFDGQRVVTAHQVDGSVEKVVVHFPDAAVPPSLPVEFSSTQVGEPDVNHPDIQTNSTHMMMVWSEADAEDSQIVFASCRFASVDCTDQANWLGPSVVVTGYEAAKFPQLAVDGTYQLVIFQYDADPTGGFKTRVMATERCGTGAWSTPELIRTPASDSFNDQAIVFGRPGVALNRNEHIAHVGLIENVGYGNAYDPSTLAGEYYWLRKAYTPCE